VRGSDSSAIVSGLFETTPIVSRSAIAITSSNPLNFRYLSESFLLIFNTIHDILYVLCNKERIPMIKTLTKHGNSLALILDKPILELLNIEPETPLSVTTDGKSLILSPVQDVERSEKLTKIRARVNKKYETTFSKLAD
jgi:antitoxin component of MazEF toxin-antitoxin module